MAIEVRIPTILRTYTDGAEGRARAAGTPSPNSSPTSRPGTRGIQERLIDGHGDQLRRFVNVYLNDEDVRFLDGISTKLADGDSVTILPAVGRRHAV